jgi:hypothetical protein
MSDFRMFRLHKYHNTIYRVSHNTWDHKNALGWSLYDNVESWEVSHFEAKDHTFQTRGVRFWCVDIFAINYSKNPMTQNLDDFIYVVILPNFWQTIAQPTDHLQKWPTLLWRALFILYTPNILSFGLNVLKSEVFWHCVYHFFPPSRFFKLTLRFDGFFTMNPMCYWTPCTCYGKLPWIQNIIPCFLCSKYIACIWCVWCCKFVNFQM